MAYFRNTTVNLLNLHYGIHSLALSGSGAFFAVFLLQSGVPAPAVLASLAAILLGRLAIRPSVLVLERRFGLKPLVIAGTIGTGLQYPLLAEVHGIGPNLFLLCAVSSVADTFYWTTYHAYFASLGDVEHRGHQLGARGGCRGRRHRRAASHRLGADDVRAARGVRCDRRGPAARRTADSGDPQRAGCA
jgi:hypothetical protein